MQGHVVASTRGEGQRRRRPAQYEAHIGDVGTQRKPHLQGILSTRQEFATFAGAKLADFPAILVVISARKIRGVEYTPSDLHK